MTLLAFPDRLQAEKQGRVPELENESPLFVDWLTIRQTHPKGGLPRIAGGVVTSHDRDGALEFETIKRDKVEGSYDSVLWIRCDGNVVEFDGNISRYGRSDNVFGYSWSETLARVNRLLNLYSLPPFEAGERLRFAGKSWEFSGARVSRIDITKNHSFFNLADAQQAISILARHHIGRQKGVITPDGSTVTYGYGGKYISGKCYLKSHELRTHLKKKSGSHVGADVIEFCENAGVLREEFTLKSRFLTQTGLCWLAEIEQHRLEQIYNSRSQLQRLNDMTYPDLSTLTAAERGTLARYEAGESINLKRATFYRHRRALLAFGVDISIPTNRKNFVAPVKVIERAVLVAPEWYRRKYG